MKLTVLLTIFVLFTCLIFATDVHASGFFPSGETDSLTIERIKDKLRNEYLKNELKFMKADEREFLLEAADLNGDGKDEYFIGFFTSFYFCGSGGCSVFLLDSDLGLVTGFSVSGESIYILNDKTGGWSDLAIFSGGKYRHLKFSDAGYPENPSLCPAYTGKPENNGTVIFDYEKEKKPIKF